jgi:hypothetical protein
MRPAQWQGWRARGDEARIPAALAEFETLGFSLIFPPPDHQDYCPKACKYLGISKPSLG